MNKRLLIIGALFCFVACSGEQPQDQEEFEQEEQPKEFSLRGEEQEITQGEETLLPDPTPMTKESQEKETPRPPKERKEKGSFLDSILKKNFKKDDQGKQNKAASPQKKFQDKEKVAKQENRRQKPQIVELYVSKNCSECRATEEYLREQKIKYKKFNVGKKGKAYEQYYAIGGNGVFPFAKVGDAVVYGYDPQQIVILAQKQEQKAEQGKSEHQF